VRTILLPLCLAIAWALAVDRPAIGRSDRPVVIGYLFPRDAVISPAEIHAASLTHINYAFANIRDGEVVEGFARDAENFRVLAGLRRAHPHLRILVSVGGWTWSGGFSDAALTPESRRRFVSSAVAFVRRHDLDGFDVDWEYPGLPGYGNTHRPEDKENFTTLMAELRAALDEAGRGRGRYLLTFAAGAFTDFIAHTELSKVQEVVEYVNLMTYDFRDGSWDPIAGHHANLFTHPRDPKGRSVDQAVRAFLEAGVPAGKLVVGVPFYGRGWSGVKAEANGLYQPGGPLEPRIPLAFERIAADLVGANGFVRHWDAEAKSPYLWNAATRTFISYDDPESLRLKARYIRERGLAGAMFWQYYEDRTGTLLRALHEGLSSDE
jgi:chitinase